MSCTRRQVDDSPAAEEPPAQDDAAAADSPGDRSAGPAADRGAYRGLFGTDPIAPGWMPWMGPVSAATARRIACDCELTRIGIDEAGVPLNLGRSSRLVSPAQRRALIARDHGCAFPGCGRPPGWTQAHHIRHWINGGTTDLANLVLLCAHHYRITTGPSAARGRKRLARWWGLRGPDLHGSRSARCRTGSIHSRPRPSCQTSR